jgi:hypothetical protein
MSSNNPSTQDFQDIKNSLEQNMNDSSDSDYTTSDSSSDSSSEEEKHRKKRAKKEVRGYNKSKGSSKVDKWEKIFAEELKDGDFEAFKNQLKDIKEESKTKKTKKD